MISGLSNVLLLLCLSLEFVQFSVDELVQFERINGEDGFGVPLEPMTNLMCNVVGISFNALTRKGYYFSSSTTEPLAPRAPFSSLVKFWKHLLCRHIRRKL
jgi:hypothetical protein